MVWDWETVGSLESHGRPRVDDLRVLSDIIFINRNGLRWCDAPRECGPAKTFYNRWKRSSDNGVFARMLVGLAAEGADPTTIMIDATCLKAHRTACSLSVKRGVVARSVARERNIALHAVTDAKCWPIRFFMSAGQVGDDTGAAALSGNLPQAGWLLADRGYDADWIRKELADRGISTCSSGRKSRKATVKYDKRRGQEA